MPRSIGFVVEQEFEPKQIELFHHRTYGRVVQYQTRLDGVNISAYLPHEWFREKRGFPAKIIMAIGVEKKVAWDKE